MENSIIPISLRASAWEYVTGSSGGVSFMFLAGGGGDADAEGDDAEVEDPRGELGIDVVLADHEALGAEDDGDRRILDLDGLRLAAYGTDALRCAGGEEVERAVEVDLVADVVEAVDDRGAEHARAGERLGRERGDRRAE